MAFQIDAHSNEEGDIFDFSGFGSEFAPGGVNEDGEPVAFEGAGTCRSRVFLDEVLDILEGFLGEGKVELSEVR